LLAELGSLLSALRGLFGGQPTLLGDLTDLERASRGWDIYQEIEEGGSMSKVLVALAACLLLTGCASIVPLSSLLSTPTGGPGAQIHDETTVKLNESNFVLVKTNVTGVSKGFSLLGLITIVPPTLTTAMARMYSSAQMQVGQPQTISHFVIEPSTTYWILFGIPRVTVRADIVQFFPIATPTAIGEHPMPKPPDVSIWAPKDSKDPNSR
jgi:hypothetical protein